MDVLDIRFDGSWLYCSSLTFSIHSAAVPLSCSTIGDFEIIRIRHEKMRVASNAELGQMDNCDITAVTVHYVSPRLRHLKEYAPLFLPRVLRRLLPSGHCQ